jgi:hypothetical protein
MQTVNDLKMIIRYGIVCMHVESLCCWECQERRQSAEPVQSCFSLATILPPDCLEPFSLCY